MNFYHPFRVRLPSWSDWFGLVLMSIAAPLIAAWIHSLCVFERGFELYNAEIGGIYFHGVSGSMPPYQQPVAGWRDIVTMFSGCGVPAILTFLVLLPFRRRALYRWPVWAASIVLWIWLLFQMEITIH